MTAPMHYWLIETAPGVVWFIAAGSQREARAELYRVSNYKEFPRRIEML